MVKKTITRGLTHDPYQDLSSSIFLNDHEIRTSSLKVSEAFSKRHDDILKKLKLLECSKDFYARHFAGVEYIDKKGERRPCYEMDFSGFMFLVMGFTGKKAAQIKEAYINAFNEMDAQLNTQPTLPTPPTDTEALQRLLQAAARSFDRKIVLDYDDVVVLTEYSMSIYKAMSQWSDETKTFKAISNVINCMKRAI